MKIVHVCDAQLSLEQAGNYNRLYRFVESLENQGMPSLFKSAILGLGLLAGVGATAHAQSVSALPPTSPAAGKIVTPPPSPTTQSFFPKPGGNQAWEEQHYQPSAGYDADAAQHPYSTSIGPKPGAHSSGQDVHYQATDEDAAPSRHPYTAPGTGPKPGG
jgi:hypothetical protein